MEIGKFAYCVVDQENFPDSLIILKWKFEIEKREKYFKEKWKIKKNLIKNKEKWKFITKKIFFLFFKKKIM